MTDTPDIAALAKGLSKAQADVLFVPSDWLASNSLLSVTEHMDLAALGLIESQFPEAKLGHSGRQWWRTAPLGILVRDYLKENGA